jgi:iron complex outermembrane recepter protein
LQKLNKKDMRKLFTTLAFFCFVNSILAQSISGKLIDDNQKPLASVSIILHNAKDSSMAKIAVSASNGSFEFIGLKPNTYFVEIANGFYKKYTSSSIVVANDNVALPTISLQKDAKQLNTVTVTSKKPMIEVKADKTIFNVEASINAVGSDAFELLRKSPGVMIDKDDNVSLSGKNGVQIYVDGRPSPLSGKDLSSFLKSLQSSQIEAIELITNPSAKYDAAGNAGIINIRLKKNKSFGTNGSVNAGYAIGTYSKYNAGINLNNRNKKTNIFGSYSYNNNRNISTIDIYREISDTTFDQKGQMLNTSNNNSVKLGLDFYANKKSTFGIIFDGNFTNNTMDNYSTTGITNLPKTILHKKLIADNTSTGYNDNYNLNGNYKFIDTSGHELNIDANYGNFKTQNNQLQPNAYYNNLGVFLQSKNYNMISPSVIDIANIKVDYEQRLAGGKLEIGSKISHVKTTNDFQRYDVFATTKTLDVLRSNKFTYLEKIVAGYINFNKQYKGIMLQVGLRAENSSVKGKSKGIQQIGNNFYNYDSGFDRAYLDFFPSAAITFNKNPMSQWGITYSRRIDRPAYQDLNPFEFKLDEYTFQKGNTLLTPQYTNSFGISHTYKYMLTTTLNYSHVADIFAQLIDTAELSKSFITKKNLATQDIFSLNISYPFQKGIYSAYFNLNSYYSKYKANFGANRIVDLDVFAANFYMQHGFDLGKGYKAELSSWFSSPSISEGTLQTKSMGFVDIGVQKQILQGKGNLKLSISDIFNTMQWTGTSNFGGQYLYAAAKWESQQFKINFSYRFGKSSVKNARQRKTGSEDEKNRVKSGGGGLGG